jgi:signal transduction histidine kinase
MSAIREGEIENKEADFSLRAAGLGVILTVRSAALKYNFAFNIRPKGGRPRLFSRERLNQMHGKVLETKSLAARYGLAILASVVAILLRQILSPLLGTYNPYHTFWAAVVFCAWYCGVGPSVVTVLLDLLGAWYWFLPPAGSFALQDPKADIYGMLGFVIFSGFIIALGEANRRSKKRFEKELADRIRTEATLRESERQLEAIQTGLESRVVERTVQLDAANQNLRELSVQLLRAQDEERRRLARELHDSIGQLLAAISMNIGTVRATALNPTAEKAAAENAKLVEQISSEIRTMSHLLHPPLLDEVGLASALKWYVDGFSQRSKIAVDLRIGGNFNRLSSDVEIVLFRVVQECLTNVHRHSGSRSAEVHLGQRDGFVFVQVRDFGRGVPQDRQSAFQSGLGGVGLRGMRERVVQLGGELDVTAEAVGTVVKANIPVQSAAAGESLSPASKADC